MIIKDPPRQISERFNKTIIVDTIILTGKKTQLLWYAQQLKFEWSLTANPVLQVSAEEDALDLCGSLLVFKRTEAQDNAQVKSHTMSQQLP